MFSKTKRRIMSAFIAASMAMTPLLGYADIIRGDGGTVDNIWAVPGAEGPDISTLTISDDQPGEGYILFGKYIDDYANYEITSEDEGLMILANNSSLETPPGLNVDYRLSGECYVTVTGLMVAFTDDRFPEYEGDKSVPSLLEFYTSGTYEDDEANNHWAERLNIEVFGEMDITDWFAANDLIIDEGAVFNIGYYDEENDEWHDGHVTAGNVIIGGELHIGDKNEDGPESELIIFDDLSIQSTGKLTAACNACLVFGDMATCSAEGFPLKIRNEQGELVDFEFEDGHGRYEFVSRPVDEQDPETDIYWEYRDVGPERGENTYCVDYDDRGGEASVTVGEGEEETVLHPWDQYEFEPGTAVEFKLNPPEGYDFSTVIVEIVEFAENEDVNYSSAFETTDEHYIAIDRTNGTFEFTTDCYGYDVYIFWSPFDFRFDHDNEFVIETHSNDKGSIVLVDDSACELVEEDPYNPGNFRYLFSNEVLDDGNTLQVTFVPKTNCILQDFGININQTETFYGREERPDHLTIVFDEAENLVYNGDGTYTWTISGSGWREWYNINAYFEKIVNVNGIEIEARDATTIEYKLDDGSYNPLPLTTIGVEEGAREGYLISPETLDGHDSITFRFTYENGVIKEGVRVEYAQGTNLIVDVLPFDNDSNPYEFTLSKTGTDWNDYHIQVNDWPTPFNGTYLVTKHGPGDVTVTGVATDVLTAYEDGQTLSFTVSCDEGIYKVVGRYSNDPNNGEFDIPCNEGTYTIQPNGGGLDIMIYTTQEEYNIDHLNANYGEGEFDFEIFMNDHGFHENNAQFDGEFTFVEDEEHIKAFAASGNRTRFVVTFTDTELQTGKAKITLNLIPKYDCVYEVYVGGNKLDIENDQVEIDLSNVISGAHDPINIEVTYEDPKTLALVNTEHVTVSYSLDGETYTAFPEENIIDLKRFPDIYEIYIKTEAEEGYVCDCIDVYVNGECIESRSETRGIYWFDVSDEWVCCEIRPQVNRIGGNYTVKYAREEDSSELIFNGITPDQPVEYFMGDEIVIDTLIGDVYKAYAVSGDLAPIELTKSGSTYRFTPSQEGDYDIIFYLSEDEYVFENVEGTNFVYVNVVDMTSEAGTVRCTDSTAFAIYNGCVKFAVNGTEAVIEICPSNNYWFDVDPNGSGATFVNNQLTVSTSAATYPIITFFSIPDFGFDYDNIERDITSDAGTEVTMYAKMLDTGATGLNFIWFKSSDGENYTVIEGATSDTYTDAPIRDAYYICEVGDSYDRALRIEFTVTVTLPEISDNRTDAQKNYSVVYGDDVEIDAEQGVQVTGPKFAWYVKDGTEFTLLNGETGSKLSLTNVTASGVYKCVITDAVEQTLELEYNVNVTYVLGDTTDPASLEVTVVENNSTTLTVSVDTSKTDGTVQYAWASSADGETYAAIDGTTASITVSPTADTYYKCTVSDGKSESLEIVFTVTVIPELLDTRETGADAVAVDLGGSVTLDAKTNAVEPGYTWSESSDGENFIPIAGASGKTFTFEPTGNTVVRCTVTDKYEREIVLDFTVTVNYILTDNTTDEAKSVTITKTESATLAPDIDASKTTDVTYSWSCSTDDTFTSVEDSVTVTPDASTTYTCTVSDAHGNSCVVTYTVTVNYVLTDNTTDEAKSVTITKTESATLAPDIDASKTTDVTYSWSCSTEDTFTSAEASVTVTPEASTTYTCTVTDTHGNSCVVTFTVTVNDLPEISDLRSDSEKSFTVEYNDSVTLDAKTDAVEPTYEWAEDSDGTGFMSIPGAAGETFTFTADSNKTLRCTVTDKYGTTKDLEFAVTVNYVLTDNTTASAKSVTIIKTESTTLAPVIDDSKTTGVSYSWSSSTDSSFTSSAASITVTPNATTTYTCTVSDTHGNSCVVTFTVTVNVPKITDKRSASEKSCKVTYPNSVTLNANTDAIGPSYTWSESLDGTNFTPITGASGKTFSFKPTADETVRCKVTDKYGTTKVLDFKVTVTYKLTDKTASSAKSVTITKFDSTKLEVKVSEDTTTGIKYTWYSSTDGKTFTKMSDTAKSVTVKPTETTTYKCEVKDAHGNSINVIFKVTVKVPVLKDLTSASAKTVTADKDSDVTLEVKVNDTETTGIKYKWYKSTNGTSFNVVAGEKSSKITFKADADVTYSCTVTDKYGNSIEVVFKVTVTEPADPDSESFGGFVERLYNVALGRESEAEGKEFWVKNVEAGNLTGADAAREFLNSKEFKDKGLNDEQFLAVLYKTFFNRDYKDDPDGFNFWMNSLKSVGRDKVVDGFINSTEWCNICAEYGIRSGATTAKATIASKNAIAFAERLYTCCLGREAEPDGLKFWSLSLTNLEVSGSEAARQFFTSAEFKGFNTSNEEYIKRLYTTFMGREYDEGGLNYWLGEMKNGMSREQVFDNFASSKEFTDICNSYGIQR